MKARHARAIKNGGRSGALLAFFRVTALCLIAAPLSGCATMESTFDAINPFGGETEEAAPLKPAPKAKSLEEAAKAAQESARPAVADVPTGEVPTADVPPAQVASGRVGQPQADLSVRPTTPVAERVQPVEVMWRVPTDPVEKYYILYGTDENRLDKQVELSVKELQKIDHPKFGPVFRYELKQIPSDKTLFISLKAENRFGVSSPTPPVRLEPGKRSVTP